MEGAGDGERPEPAAPSVLPAPKLQAADQTGETGVGPGLQPYPSLVAKRRSPLLRVGNKRVLKRPGSGSGGTTMDSRMEGLLSPEPLKRADAMHTHALEESTRPDVCRLGFGHHE